MVCILVPTMSPFRGIFIVAITLLVQGDHTSAFKPPGEYDVGPSDLAALCPLVKQYMDDGETPAPADIVDVPEGPDCVYFKWIACPPPNPKDKKKIREQAYAPCGHYEMKKCGEERRRRRRRAFGGPMNATDPGLPQIGFKGQPEVGL